MNITPQSANYIRIAHLLLEVAAAYGSEVCIRINEDNELVFSIEGNVHEAQLMVMNGVACHISVYDRRKCTDEESIYPVADDISDYDIRSLLRNVLTVLSQ